MQIVWDFFRNTLGLHDADSITAFVLGIVCLVVAIVAAQFKDMRKVLAFELFSNLAIALNFLFHGAMTGFLSCGLASVHIIFNYFYQRKGIPVPRWSLIPFFAAYLAIAILTWEAWYSILPFLCTILFGLAIFSSSTRYRVYMSGNSGLWLLYSILLADWGAVINYTVLLGMLLVTMVRIDLLHRPETAADAAESNK